MGKLSFVMPCYNSALSVEGVIHDIIKTVAFDGRYDYEIICVNDSSPDNTYEVLKGIAAKNRKVKVINLTKNFGQHSATMAGLHCVTGDIVIWIDDDGQNPPSEVFKLIDKLGEGYDLVSAKYPNKKHSWFRKFGSKVSMFMSTHLVGKPKDIDLNSYCVFKRFIADEIIKYTNAYPFVHGLMLRITRNIANVEIEHRDRLEGQSGYSLSKLLALWMNGFTAFSEKPLRLASILGFLCAIFGFVMGIVTIVRKLIHPEILVGYSSIMTSLFLLSGIIMLFLGLLGEYIGRMYISINNAPQYAIKETINVESNDTNTLAD